MFDPAILFHDPYSYWLGVFSAMISSPVYYPICKQIGTVVYNKIANRKSKTIENKNYNLNKVCGKIHKLFVDSNGHYKLYMMERGTSGENKNINSNITLMSNCDFNIENYNIHVYFNNVCIINFIHTTVTWEVEKIPALEEQLCIALNNYYNIVLDLENKRIANLTTKNVSKSQKLLDLLSASNKTGKLNIAKANNGELMLAQKDD